MGQARLFAVVWRLPDTSCGLMNVPYLYLDGRTEFAKGADSMSSVIPYLYLHPALSDDIWGILNKKLGPHAYAKIVMHYYYPDLYKGL